VSDLFLAPGAASELHCPACAATAPADRPADTCASCGALLDARHALPGERGRALAGTFAARRTAAWAGTPPDAQAGLNAWGSGVWRFRELVMPGAAPAISWPEGNTPLVERDAVCAYAGAGRLLLKHEGMNPSGSFKDRGMTVAVTHAARAGASAVACASTGNTAASLAAYAAQAGLPAMVFVPAGKVAGGKLAQAIAYGARVLQVRGDFDDCLALARAASHELGVYLANSVNPWRIEGQKTITFELLEQLGWRAPDWIALPGGALGNTAALGKALREARALGLIDRTPRILTVQAAGAAPFARAFATEFAERHAVKADTVATAIRIGDPASWDRAVRAIRETGGVVASVTDDEILDAKAVVDATGVGCEPASAASVAGVRALGARGTIGAGDTVVCVLTGHLLKDADTVTAFHASAAARANPPVEIDADLRAVERFVPRR
jgi:threonine synthase